MAVTTSHKWALDRAMDASKRKEHSQAEALVANEIRCQALETKFASNERARREAELRVGEVEGRLAALDTEDWSAVVSKGRKVFFSNNLAAKPLKFLVKFINNYTSPGPCDWQARSW